MLRLVAMFMVVILHVLGRGGVLAETTGAKQHVAWLLETTAFCAVDCYGIISGFVSYNENEKPYRYAKFFSFWVPVFIYSFGITLLAFTLRPESVGIKALIKSFLPIASGAYWYVGAYAGLFFIIPWLNKFLRSCSSKEATRFITVVLIVFVGYQTFANCFGDCFSLRDGYSFVWLSLLYVVGAWMKKCNIPKRMQSSHFMLGGMICILISWAAHELIPTPRAKIFLNYTSLTIVFVAVSLVAVFSKLRIGDKPLKVIACFAPAAFGVYLIHVHLIVWDHFLNSAFTWIANFPAWMLPILVLVSALGIFIVCLCIEKVRLVLFKLLRINRFIGGLEKKLEHIVNYIFDKATSRI